ncbi:hypothetical protein [[Phormidium] sp. ETS-05]|uniref:hypothetical protein n=1 Tax=[Phormidium] sp. ETS-05 TaxID=222819 RepID=UPI0018EF10BD|nr:hypothetical protein [[Phormidium] sp. ETS-05]
MAIFGTDTNNINTNRYVGDSWLKICKEKLGFLTKPAYDAEVMHKPGFWTIVINYLQVGFDTSAHPPPPPRFPLSSLGGWGLCRYTEPLGRCRG